MAILNGHFEDADGNVLLPIPSGITATVENSAIASQAYPKGTYLYFNNRLCKTNTAIASGATLSVGSNLTYTSIGAEMTSHLVASTGRAFTFQDLINKNL